MPQQKITHSKNPDPTVKIVFGSGKIAQATGTAPDLCSIETGGSGIGSVIRGPATETI